MLGTPLDPDRYDYAHAVLWNNHAPDLWRRFTIYLRRTLAERAGLTQVAFKEACRVPFGKVAEYQRRGAVHFHAVIRLDGPDGPDTPPPAWATPTLLDGAIRSAARRAVVPLAAVGGRRARVLQWGAQVDVRQIGAFASGELSEQAVASYVAKYATNSAEATESVDRRILERHELDRHDLPDHTRRLIEERRIAYVKVDRHVRITETALAAPGRRGRPGDRGQVLPGAAGSPEHGRG